MCRGVGDEDPTYLARQMRRARLQFVQRDNVFTQVKNIPRAQELADRFERENWPKRLRAIARRVMGGSELGKARGRR